MSNLRSIEFRVCSDFGFDKNVVVENAVERIRNYTMSILSVFSGDKLMYIDFAFGEILSHIQLFSPDSLEKTPKVKNYLERFEALDKIAAYRKSDKFRKFPIYGPSAHWGGQSE